MADRPRILIVGAGIAGLTLAAGLERYGISPTIVEINQASLSRGLALMLTSNVALALRRIGVDKAVIERGTVLEQIVQSDVSGTPAAQHDLRPSNDRYAPNLGITRDALISCLSGGDRAPIRYATTIASLDGSADVVEVVFSDGERDQFDLVVGADGVHSAVRKLIHPKVEPIYRSFCGWRTVMECSDGDTVFRIRSGRGRLLGSFQVAPNLVYAFLLAHYAALPALSRDAQLKRFKELASEFDGTVPSLIQQQDDPASVVFAPVREVETPSYHRGRMLLIGDAAHAFPPQLAQGAAMAIEDAVALSGLVGKSSDVERVLQSYELRRRPRVESIRAAVRNRAISGGMEGPVTAELLKQHPHRFSNSLKVYEDLIEDPFAAGEGAAWSVT
jgi:2-polyprenyl-6-methoxyphenol hydroxylase-like FAD-dependent oxidoreductase